MQEPPESFFDFYAEFLHAVSNRRASPQKLQADLAKLTGYVNELRAQLKGLQHEDLAEELYRLNESFALFESGRRILHESLGSQDEVTKVKGLEALEEAFERIRAGLTSVNERQAIRGPFKDKLANAFFNGIAAFKSGTIPPEMFQSVAGVFLEHWRGSARNFRRLLKTSGWFPEARRDLEQMQPAYEEARKAIVEIEQAATGSLEGIDQPLRIVGAFLDRHLEFCLRMQAKLEARMASEPEAKMKCPRCHKENSEGLWACHHCGFVFPNFAASETEFPSFQSGEGEGAKGQISVAPNVQNLLDAIEDYQDNEIPTDQLARVLSRMEQKLSSALVGIDALEAEASDPLLREILSGYRTGIAEMAQGLAHLRTWIKSQDESDLENGVRLCLQGSQQISEGQSVADAVSGASSKPIEPDASVGGIG